MSTYRTTGQVNKKPQATGYKYSKIEQFYTPVENGTSNEAKRKSYSESQFDNNGNLLKYIFRPYDGKYVASVNTYRYENNRRIEQLVDGRRSFCTYNNNGDTLEVKEYGHKKYGKENTLIKRLVYTYGSNGKKSVVIAYVGHTDTITDKTIYTYNDRNLLVRQQYSSFMPTERIEVTVINTYNSSGNIIQSDLDAPPMKFNAQTKYTYNDKGWVMECINTFNSGSDSNKHIYSYNADGLRIKEHILSSENEAVIDYVYTNK